MEACTQQKLRTPLVNDEPAPEIAQWLRVSGDIDDLIYYDQEPRQSER